VIPPHTASALPSNQPNSPSSKEENFKWDETGPTPVYDFQLLPLGYFSWLVLFGDTQGDEVWFLNPTGWNMCILACSQAQPDLAERYPEVMSLVTQNLVRFPAIGGPDDVITRVTQPDVTSALVTHNFMMD